MCLISVCLITSRVWRLLCRLRAILIRLIRSCGSASIMILLSFWSLLIIRIMRTSWSSLACVRLLLRSRVPFGLRLLILRLRRKIKRHAALERECSLGRVAPAWMRTSPGLVPGVFFCYCDYASILSHMEAMMRHRVYTVFDSKAQVYMNPIYFRADGEALRAFRASVNAPGHQFNNNAGDYTLFAIGEYDDDKGVIFMYDSFSNLGNGAQFKEVV